MLINLAIADCLFALVYPIYCSTLFLIDDWSIMLFQCYVYVLICKTILTVSPLCTAAISLERLVIIYFPFRVKSYRRTHKLMIVALIWFSACLLSLDDVIYIHVSYEQSGEIYCRGGQYYGDGSSSFFPKLMVIDIVVPFTIVIVSFLIICIRFHIRKKKSLASSQSNRNEKGIDKLIGMMAIDALTSIVPFLLFYILVYTSSIAPEYPLYYTYKDLLEGFYVTSAYSMPVIYLIFNTYFRKDLLLLFQRMRCKTTTECSQNVPETEASSQTPTNKE
ncbi:RYamide receptor-like [Watersipora subatra]|uniref:RYamide receptor-like n=1 Tax=Watersipora subatra TaxID=2589382 RepID=UPI00355BD403